MPQSPDIGDTAPTPYSAPGDIPGPVQSVSSDPINKSKDFRNSKRVPSRRLGLKDHTSNYPDIVKAIPLVVTAVAGEEYSKITCQEAYFKQSSGRWVINPYGLIFDDAKVLYGSEPSVIMQTDAIPTIPVEAERTTSQTLSVVQDSGGEWNAIASGGGGGGSSTGTILKITEVLSINVYRCSVIDNSNNQIELATNKTLYLPNNTRAGLGVNAIVPAILQSDGSYLGMVSLIY